MKTGLYFGTLYRLDVQPKDQALADPEQVTHSGKVRQTVLEEEHKRTGRYGNQSTILLDGEFYSAAGDTLEEAYEVEKRFQRSLPKIEQFVLEHASDEDEVIEVLGEQRFKEIRAAAEQCFLEWITNKIRTENCPVLKIDLNA